MATLTKAQRTERDEAIASLRDLLPVGSTVHTVLRHVSRSGMLRHIDVVVIRDGSARTISWEVARACGYRQAPNGSLKVGGCGMDMGFSVVYGLSRTLYSDGHPCIGQGCPSNDHTNDWGRLAREFHAKSESEDDTTYCAERSAWIKAQEAECYAPTRIHSDGGYCLSQKWL